MRRWPALAAGLALALCPAVAAPAGSATTNASTQERRDIAYRTIGDHTLRLDFYPARAARNPAPLVIHMHGGGWSRGSRPAGPGAFRPWLEAGFAVATIEYRLAGEAKAPAAVDDVHCALAWAARNAATLGIDPARIVLTGTSAGGHLALVAGLRSDPAPADCGSAPSPAAIVNLYGPADLRAVPGVPPSPSIANWIGDGGDAMRAAMSPVLLLRADSPPIFTIHGDADLVVPVASAHLLASRASAVGARSGTHIVPGGRHGGFPAGEQARAMAAAFAFLRAHGILSQ